MAADVATLADTLGIRRFRVLGLSGGGPYALACAATLRDRVVRVSLVSALGPLDTAESAVGMMRPNRLLLRLVRHTPDIFRPGLGVTSALLRRLPALYRRWLTTHVSEADRAVLSDPVVAAMLRSDLAEALRQGAAGVWSDLRALTAPWGFEMDQIDTPADVWHGDTDRIVPQQMGHFLARRLPHARWRPVTGGGHFLVIPPLARHTRCVVRMSLVRCAELRRVTRRAPEWVAECVGWQQALQQPRLARSRTPGDLAAMLGETGAQVLCGA